eukprot:CAMPEP_0194043368 /NCGR_PEP_ID=MMETSP0009_2-20130614/15020_1 /TAXON_ID=210454 /ORGANISM="Grammatophora oceanica, Strain CCMP 410" /LENGTH=54 /DNA_ID=CAMNT_0038687555 /DNA_START=50 /DNA_END=211 /DNA_ORIENTATION=+
MTAESSIQKQATDEMARILNYKLVSCSPDNPTDRQEIKFEAAVFRNNDKCLEKS